MYINRWHCWEASVEVRRELGLVFAFDGVHAVDVDLVDYH
jgi:plasmid maintenance system killer protein